MLVSRSQQINKLRSLIGEEQAKFKAIFENSPEGILQISPEGHILAANPALAGIFGYASPKELMEQLTDMKAQLYVDPMRFTEFQKRLQQEKVVREFQSEIKCRDGSRKWISETARQVTQPDGSLLHCQGFVVDITTQKSAQKDRDRIEVQLRQSQKLESIGQLAAGIAHEMNTPLQYIGDNTRFVKDSFETISKVLQGQAELCAAMKANAVTPELMARHDEIVAASDLNYLCGEIPSALNQALEGIGRVSKIVKAMKEFSHPGSKEKAAVNLNKAIENTVTIARHEWHYVADVNLELEPDLPLVQCYSGEFNQCILNLVVNAAHAIGDVIKQRPDTKGLITVRTRRDLDQVEVRVTDTGTGIPEAARSKIFEPFFTTKMVGKGTGQGLSIVYANIVKKHGGTVTFETETGKGTSFIVRLPITAAPAPVAS
jgi:PAS domain S-box-containing protein